MPINKETPVATINGLSIEGSLIRLDSDEWFAWLNNNTKFRFECGLSAKFTAYKDKKGYWTAQRRWNRKLRHEHLGKSEQLNWELLQETANKLNTRDTVYWRNKYPCALVDPIYSPITFSETVSMLPLQIADRDARLKQLNWERDLLLKRLKEIDDIMMVYLANHVVHDDSER